MEYVHVLLRAHQTRRDLMKQCWDGNPVNRPSAAEAWNVIAYKWKELSFEFNDCTEELPQPMQSVSHPYSVYSSRFIPSIPALEAYARTKKLQIDQIDDDDWETIVS